MTPTPVIVPIDTPTLGDRSYLAHDGSVAVVVDPQRDIDRVLALADDAGVRITARLRDPHPQRLPDRRARPGRRPPERATTSTPPTTSPTTGPRSATATSSRCRRACACAPSPPRATPSPTSPTPSSPGPTTAEPRPWASSPAVRCSSARPVGPTCSVAEHTHDLVHHQYASAHRLADELPEHTHVLPTHGFGIVLLRGLDGRHDRLDHRRARSVTTPP